MKQSLKLKKVAIGNRESGGYNQCINLYFIIYITVTFDNFLIATFFFFAVTLPHAPTAHSTETATKIKDDTQSMTPTTIVPMIQVNSESEIVSIATTVTALASVVGLSSDIIIDGSLWILSLHFLLY